MVLLTRGFGEIHSDKQRGQKKILTTNISLEWISFLMLLSVGNNLYSELFIDKPGKLCCSLKNYNLRDLVKKKTPQHIRILLILNLLR